MRRNTAFSIAVFTAAVITPSTVIASSGSAAWAATGSTRITNIAHLDSTIKDAIDSGFLVPPGPSKATAKFKVPKLTCTSAFTGIVPGVFLGVEFGGITAGEVQMYCLNGSPTYEAQYTLNNVVTSLFPVQPGDTMIVAASESSDETQVSVKDVTSHQSNEASQPSGDGVFNPLIGTIGVADNGVPGGVPKFKTLPFTSVSVGGKSLGSFKPVAVDRYSGKILQLEPSAITGGNAFNMLFKHS